MYKEPLSNEGYTTMGLLNYIRYIETLDTGEAFFEVCEKGELKNQVAFLHELDEVQRLALEHSYRNDGRAVDLVEVIYYKKLLQQPEL